MPPQERASSALTIPHLLSAALFALTSLGWFVLEIRAHAMFDAGQLPDYDWQVDSLSDLGVDYRQVHPLKPHNVHSHRHATQNFNFTQAGVCFAVAQTLLLFASRRRLRQQASRGTALLRTARLVLALAYAGGMVLVARVHGGPREKHWRIIGWHWMGFAMAAVGGNVGAMLTALSPTVGAFERSAAYRLASFALGIVGLYSFYQFQTLGEWDYLTKLGLWQRGSVYPVLAWEAMTAVVLVVTSLSGGNRK